LLDQLEKSSDWVQHQKGHQFNPETISLKLFHSGRIGLHHPADGVTNLKYKL